MTVSFYVLIERAHARTNKEINFFFLSPSHYAWWSEWQSWTWTAWTIPICWWNMKLCPSHWVLHTHIIPHEDKNVPRHTLKKASVCVHENVFWELGYIELSCHQKFKTLFLTKDLSRFLNYKSLGFSHFWSITWLIIFCVILCITPCLWSMMHDTFYVQSLSTYPDYKITERNLVNHLQQTWNLHWKQKAWGQPIRTDKTE